MDDDEEELLFLVSISFQLKNGNIFAIYNKFYIFKEESITEEPISVSEKIPGKYYGHITKYQYTNKFNEEKRYYKNVTSFNTGKFYDTRDNNITILLIDPFKTEIDLVILLPVNNLTNLSNSPNSHYYIIKVSQYYPENLYIVSNRGKSFLLIFNLEEFVGMKNYERNPISMITISE